VFLVLGEFWMNNQATLPLRHSARAERDAVRVRDRFDEDVQRHSRSTRRIDIPIVREEQPDIYNGTCEARDPENMLLKPLDVFVKAITNTYGVPFSSRAVTKWERGLIVHPKFAEDEKHEVCQVSQNFETLEIPISQCS
jgi:hypothetical protein